MFFFIPSLSLNWILSLFAVGNLESNIPLQQLLSAKLLPVNDYFNVPVLYSNEGKKVITPTSTRKYTNKLYIHSKSGTSFKQCHTRSTFPSTFQ